MNLISKRVDEKIKKNRLTKYQKNRLKNTIKFSKKFDIKIIYQKIDFITLKITNKNYNIKQIEEKILSVYPSQKIFENDIEIKNLYNILILFDKFILLNGGLAFSNQKKIYNIYDLEKNKIGQLTLKNIEQIKGNKNVIDSLELSGLFFKCYDEYFYQFLNYFGISDSEKNIIKRIDYCVDFQGIEVFEFQEYLKDLQKKSKIVNGLTATDLKQLKQNNIKIKYGKKEIYINFISEHNDLKIYDKILDILQNYKKRTVNGKNPYQDYLDSEFPIARIEIKKKKFNNLTDNSIQWVFQNIEALFFDYILRYFDIDLSLYLGIDKTLNGKKIFLAQEEKSKSLFKNLQMFIAYGNNLKDMLGEKEFFKIIYKNWPKIESTTSLNLLDEFEAHELLNQIFPKKIDYEK